MKSLLEILFFLQTSQIICSAFTRLENISQTFYQTLQIFYQTHQIFTRHFRFLPDTSEFLPDTSNIYQTVQIFTRHIKVLPDISNFKQKRQIFTRLGQVVRHTSQPLIPGPQGRNNIQFCTKVDKIYVSFMVFYGHFNFFIS